MGAVGSHNRNVEETPPHKPLRGEHASRREPNKATLRQVPPVVAPLRILFVLMRAHRTLLYNSVRRTRPKGESVSARH
jgi:hypothetical protein